MAGVYLGGSRWGRVFGGYFYIGSGADFRGVRAGFVDGVSVSGEKRFGGVE